MKWTRKGYGQLRRADDTVISQHTVAEEAYERASREGPGKYVWHPARVEIEVPEAAAPEPAPVPTPVPQPDPAPEPTPDPVPTPPSSSSSAPLLQKSDLAYVGAFRVPNGTSEAASFWYGGTALGYNPVNNSLFMTGHDHYQLSAEISIPAVVNSTNLTSLATAALLQPFRDPTEGRRNSVNPTDVNGIKIGGHFVYGGYLYVSAHTYYEAQGTGAVASHFRRPLNLSTTGQVIGPVKVGNNYPTTIAGYMATIPPEWQSAFGAPAFTGHTGTPGSHTLSMGPVVETFDPAQIGQANPVPSQRLLFYSLFDGKSLPDQYGVALESPNPYWTHMSWVTGAAFPNGTRSILFFGRHGLGAACYGTSCNDPTFPGVQGYHAYPYIYQVWAYDANDLLAVKAGSKAYWQVKPYAIWKLELPFARDEGLLGGAAYDPSTNRIYISQYHADGYNPVIHVFEV